MTQVTGPPRLTVQLVQVAAKLEVPDKLVVTRTVYWPFRVHVDRMALDVREASGVADLTGVQVQARPSSVGTEPITGQLVVGSLAAAPAGQSFDRRLKLREVAGDPRFVTPAWQPAQFPHS